MKIADANIVLRYLLNDTEGLEEIALELYGNKRLGFVDTLLYAYNKVRGYKVYTFDTKLKKLLED